MSLFLAIGGGNFNNNKNFFDNILSNSRQPTGKTPLHLPATKCGNHSCSVPIPALIKSSERKTVSPLHPHTLHTANKPRDI